MPNDNRVTAGSFQNGVLTLHLEAREGRWFPDGDGGPSIVMQMFAEAGHAPQNPGPLIRVRTGTMIHVSVRNALRDSTLVVYGLHTRPASPSDTVQVAPGATRQLEFPAGEPGTYFYWASTTHQSVDVRNGRDSQLHGAFIIDSAGSPPPRDRVFVLGSWTGPEDRSGITADLRVINGLSWPHTERLTYAAGDTIQWRWVNPTDSPHPMHLHGFYFDVTSRGSWAADTAVRASDPAHVVTEMPLSGGTFAMRWVPEEPGNWLVHCHVAYHTSMFLSATPIPDPKDPFAVDPMSAMRGMVIGVVVKPGASPARRAESGTNAQTIRHIAQAATKRYKGRFDEIAFVKQDGATPPPPDSVPAPSSLLVLQRGKPVRITIVNHLRTTTGVHWHGIEVPAYSDGVPGYSGTASRTAPMIAPGDSFVAAFTPPRSGTFIYHAHANETFQIGLGLYGALLVVDPGTYDPRHERIILLGPEGPGTNGARINGRVRPDTLRLTAGQTYLVRLIHMIMDWTVRVALVRDDSVVQWRPLAKD
ncbi:MAG TPA: multicopper oxidase domain-containing protein, partial [Gemmatimonadaceae bacterium]|nr:multicopper oxidase domain-containing protein [Gemmatimonadaceae bacterium]